MVHCNGEAGNTRREGEGGVDVGGGAGIWVKALLLCLGGVRGASYDEENYDLEEEEKTCECVKTSPVAHQAPLTGMDNWACPVRREIPPVGPTVAHGGNHNPRR